jgi:hypothetical protein
MDDDDLAQLLAMARAGIGVAMLAAPGLVAGTWVGFTEGRSPSGRTLARALGARELALGLGLKRASTAGVACASGPAPG